jgi:hypothetical protein
MSSSRAALTKTVPTRVCMKSNPVAAPLMTTKVVPRDVADKAAPMMKVSTGPIGIVSDTHTCNVLCDEGIVGGRITITVPEIHKQVAQPNWRQDTDTGGRDAQQEIFP